MHDMGAEVALKRFTVSCLHARTRSQWHTVGQWLCATFALAPLPTPLHWTPQLTDAVELPPRALSARHRDALAEDGGRGLVDGTGAVVSSLADAEATPRAIAGRDVAGAVDALAAMPV